MSRRWTAPSQRVTLVREAEEVAVIIEINDKQCFILSELVDIRLRNLSTEIRHTDSPSVRQVLRDERESLRSLAPLLSESLARV
jgi:hypothetical protein